MGYWDKENKPVVESNAPVRNGLENLEADTLEELGEVEASFRDRMKKEAKRFDDMCDTGYWFCVCFQNGAQMREFMEKIGISPDLKYVDGRDMARAYRKSLKTPDMEFAKVRPFDREYLDRAKEI